MTAKTKENGKDIALNETDHREKMLNFPSGDRIVKVTISWTVKSRTISGEVDLDASCLIFDKYGKFKETIFWDNLTTNGIIHKGDEKLEEQEESSEKDDDNNSTLAQSSDNSREEIIEVNFEKLDKSVSYLIFVLNIFNNKTFANLTKIEFKIHTLDGVALCKYSVPELKKIRENNALIMAKIFKKKDGQRIVEKNESQDWFVRVISNPQTMAFGQVVDILIPVILKEREDKKKDGQRIVEPLVKTWEKINIEILEGRGLSVQDSNGKSDPFVKIECGTWKVKTTIKKETLNPTWNDATFELKYEDTEENDITFYVKDYDRLGKNEFIGQFQVPISKIPANREIKRWFSIEPLEGATERKKAKTTGSISVKLTKTCDSELKS